MKRLKYYIISLVLATATFSSCELFKDRPINRIGETVIWDDPSFLNLYLNPMYRNMHQGNYSSVTGGFLKNMSTNSLIWYTDQMTVGYSAAYTSTYGDMLAGKPAGVKTYAKKINSNNYNYIAYANILLDAESSIVNADKKRIVAEAHFFRGWYHYRQWIHMGGVMIFDHRVDPLVKAEKFPRASFEQMVDFIVKEANMARDGLQGTYPAQHVGRIRKGAAIMLKAKTYYWAAAERFQNAPKPYLGFTDNRSAEMLEKCAQAYEELFALSDHDLIAIPQTNTDEIVRAYRKIFLVKHSKESILEVQHNNEGKGDGNLFFNNIDDMSRTPYEGGVRCLFNPTQNHVDEYRMNNGKRINDVGSGYSDQNPYINRDVRFYANVIYDGCKYRVNYRNTRPDSKQTVEIRTKDGVAGVDMTPPVKNGAKSLTGYYMAKMTNEEFQFVSSEYSKQNCIVWRLAEAYLDYAHVKLLLGGADAAAKAKLYVNYIRERVHEIPLETVSLDDVMNERRVELAFEESIYWDILRGGNAEKIMSGSTNPLKGVVITETTDPNTQLSTTIYTYPVVNNNDDVKRKFANEQLFIPLNWDDVRYHGVENNPGWTE